MPAGLPYFAWIDAGETVFGSEHMRWDEAIYSFKLSQEEGDPASLTVVIRRPYNDIGNAIGLLGPGRKIWAWFALDCGPALIKFRGRLVGIPTSIFEELVTLEFVAKPADLVAQKAALADTLRVLPYYDEAVIEPARRTDPDVVLEGYTAIWHYDRETHVITVSDLITGVGLVEFDGSTETGKVLYDGLGLTLTSGPLSRVDVSAEFTWTQQARGDVDLTDYLISNWPTTLTTFDGTIHLSAGDWPKNNAGIGDGWIVSHSTATDLLDFTVHTKTIGSTLTTPSGKTSSITESSGSLSGGIIQVGSGAPAIVKDDIKVTYKQDPDGEIYASSYSRSYSGSSNYIVQQEIKPTLVAGYNAERQCTERVTFSLIADVQPILTDPEDGEALRIDNVRSVNLTEGGMIGDARRRSYIASERGNRSLEHLILLARANLMKRARVIEIAFVPKLSRMPEITLRKNVFLVEPRVGEALGKIIGYSVALDGSDGRINCEVRIGCAIGRGGSVAEVTGTPTYCTVDYVGFDYQQYIGRAVLVGIDGSVAYEPPVAEPNDDGLDLLSGLTADDVIEVPLVVEVGPDPEDEVIEQPPWVGTVGQTAEQARAEYIKKALTNYEVRAKFKLISMTRDFSTDYDVQVSDLKIPTGYDLEAA